MMDDYEYKKWEQRKAPLESDEWTTRTPSKLKRKRLKKFCRGIEGREHVPTTKKNSWANGRQCGPQNRTGYTWNTCYHFVVCETCGKVLKWSTPRICSEYSANVEKKYKAEQEARMAAFRARYHIKQDVVL